MPGAGCDDIAAAGSEGRRGVSMSRRFGAAIVEAILAIGLEDNVLICFQSYWVRRSIVEIVSVGTRAVQYLCIGLHHMPAIISNGQHT